MDTTKTISRELYDSLYRIAELYKDVLAMDAEHEYGEVDYLISKVFNYED